MKIDFNAVSLIHFATMCCPDATVPIKANYKSGYRPQWAIFYLGCNDKMSSNCDKSLNPLCFGDELLTIKTCRESPEDINDMFSAFVRFQHLFLCTVFFQAQMKSDEGAGT